MKVTCQSCQAKYTIADEKVRGKVAKIRCKKCGTTIIVGGAEGQSSIAPPSEAPAASASGQSAEEQWSIVVAEGDEREVSASQLTALYAAGTINDATVVWKQGMPDWLPIGEISTLRSLTEASRPSRLPLGQPSVAPLTTDFNASSVASAPRTRPGEGGAARRVARAGAADLFAASSDDVTTSASASPASARPIEDKPTGARNENSVLFSLSALTGGSAPSAASGFTHAPEVNPSSARADLSSLVRGADKPAGPAKNKLDDIMNLGGGGLYSPALMAPSLTAPSIEFSPSDAPSRGKGKSKGVLMLGVGAAVILSGAVAAFSAMSSNSRDTAAAAASASASASALAVGFANSKRAGSAPAAMSDESAEKPAAEAPSAAPTNETMAAATTMTPGQATPKPEVEKRPVAAAPKPERVEKPDVPDKPAAPPPPRPVAAPAPAAASTADFDRAAALSALSAAATAAQGCKKPDGPTGAGRISVTFANNGSATTATVEGPPFAGTPVGGCVAARFRSSHIPAFAGSPVTVHKSFNIN